MVLSGRSPDDLLVEMVELPHHPYFIACQFHPEFKSKPHAAHPLFTHFIAAARRYAEIVMRSDPADAGRIGALLERGDQAYAKSGSKPRPACIVHCDLHHANVLTADRIYFIDWEFAQVGDPLLDLACVLAYYPRAVPHGSLLLGAAGLDVVAADVACRESKKPHLQVVLAIAEKPRSEHAFRKAGSV